MKGGDQCFFFVPAHSPDGGFPLVSLNRISNLTPIHPCLPYLTDSHTQHLHHHHGFAMHLIQMSKE